MWDLNYDHCSVHIKTPKWTIGRWSNETCGFTVGVGSGRRYIKAGSESIRSTQDGEIHSVTFMSTKGEEITLTGIREDLQQDFSVRFQAEYYLFSECVWTYATLTSKKPSIISYEALQTILFKELGYNEARFFISHFDDFDTYAHKGMRVTCSKP